MKLSTILAFLFPIRHPQDVEIYGPLSPKDKMWLWYVPNIGLAVLPAAALCYLFSDSLTTPHKVLFSNDGPLGVMNSDHLRGMAVPGSGHWDDLNWLGNNGGVTPISPSYLIIGLMYSPWFCAVCITLLGLFYFLSKSFIFICKLSKTDHINKKHMTSPQQTKYDNELPHYSRRPGDR